MFWCLFFTSILLKLKNIVMAETAGGKNSARIKRNVTKLAFRGKEKIIRTLGGGEETKDEIIDNYVHLVNKQQTQFQKFHHDMKRYLQSIMVMKLAAKDFYDSLMEIYEDAWMGKDMLSTLTQTTDVLYTDLHARLNAEVLTAVQNHLTQCNEMKVKVNKRGRKLVDFDGARRNLNALQNAKKLEESKLLKVKEHVTHTHETYEALNSQLHDELPDLHDSRVTLCTDVISSVAEAEKSFHDELSEVRLKLMNVAKSVRDAFDNGDYKIQRLHSPAPTSASCPQSKEPDTLPADEVKSHESRSRGYSDRSSRSSGGRKHSSTSGNRHDSPSRRTSRHDDSLKRHRNSNRERSHDYVNIPVGTEDPGHMTNGHDQSETSSHIYSPVAEDQTPVKPEPQVPSVVQEKPKPSPRLMTAGAAMRDDTSVSSEEGPSSGAGPQGPQAMPRAALTLPATQQAGDEVKMRSKSMERNHSANPEATLKKRKSMFEVIGINKIFSSRNTARHEPDPLSDKTEKKGILSKFGPKKRNHAPSPMSHDPKLGSKAHLDNGPGPTDPNPEPESRHSSFSAPVFAKMESASAKAVGLSDDVSDDDSPLSVSSDQGGQASLHPGPGPLESDCDEQSPDEDGGVYENVHPTPTYVGKQERQSSTEAIVGNEALTGSGRSASLSLGSDHVGHDAGSEVEIRHGDVADDVDSKSATHERDDVVDAGGEVGDGGANDDSWRRDDPDVHSQGPGQSHVAESAPADNPNSPHEEMTFRAAHDVRADVVPDALAKFDDRDDVTSEQGRDESDQDCYETVIFRDGPGGSDQANLVARQQPAMSENESKQVLQRYNGDNAEDDEDCYETMEFRGMPDAFSAEVSIDETVAKQQPAAKESEKSDVDDQDCYETMELHTRVTPGSSIGGSTVSTQSSLSQLDLGSQHALSAAGSLGSVVSPVNQTSPVNQASPANQTSPANQQSIVIEQSVTAIPSKAPSTPDEASSPTNPDMEPAPSQPSLRDGDQPSGTGLHANDDQSIYENFSGESARTSNLPALSINKALQGMVDYEPEDVYESPLPVEISDAPKLMFEQDASVYEVPADIVSELNTAKYTEDTQRNNPSGPNPSTILPPHYMYTVQAMYPYNGADDDELSFGKGDVIYVVEFPDPEEQDDGWQMGIPKTSWEDTRSTSAMGVFPENFTRKI